MAKFSDVFFASDFDQTLTDRNGAVPQKNIEAIEYFISQGGIFCVASGRSVPMFRSRFHQVPTNSPSILYNGAACYDYRTEQQHYACPLSDFAPNLRQKIEADYPDVTIEIQGLQYHYISEGKGWREDFLRSQQVPYRCSLDNIAEPWMKLVVTDGMPRRNPKDPKDVPPEDAARFAAICADLAAFCGDRCYVTRSMPTVIEICAGGISKGAAARRLSRDLGRSILVCAGDAPNDETMLREADFAFSPADRDPGLRGDFFRETVVCNEGCIAHAISQLETLL